MEGLEGHAKDFGLISKGHGIPLYVFNKRHDHIYIFKRSFRLQVENVWNGAILEDDRSQRTRLSRAHDVNTT